MKIQPLTHFREYAASRFRRAAAGLAVLGKLTCLTIAMSLLVDGQIKDPSVVTLNECWHYRSTDVLNLRPAVDGSNVYLAENGGRVSAVSLASGTRLWSAELGGEIRSNIVVHGPSVFVVTFDAGKHTRLRTLSVNSGIPTSEVEFPPGENVRLAVAGGRLIAALDTGFVAAYEFGSEKSTWQGSIPGIDLSTIAFSTAKMMASSADKRIRVISLEDGKELSNAPVLDQVSAVEILEGDILAGDNRGNLTRYNDDYRSISWRFRNGARIAGIVPTEHGILTASLDNFVYMVSGYNGDIRWKKRMAGRVSSIAADGDLGIVEIVGEPNAVFLNLDNGKAVGSLSIADDDSFTQPVIVADGRLIFFTNTRVIAESRGPCPPK